MKIQYFHLFKKCLYLDVSSNLAKKSCFFSKVWKFWKNRCFDDLLASWFHVFPKSENRCLHLTATAQIHKVSIFSSFWWALDSAISLFFRICDFYWEHRCSLCLRGKNQDFQVFLVFFTQELDSQSILGYWKRIQNHTHHKTTPNSVSERLSRLTWADADRWLVLYSNPQQFT